MPKKIIALFFQKYTYICTSKFSDFMTDIKIYQLVGCIDEGLSYSWHFRAKSEWHVDSSVAEGRLEGVKQIFRFIKAFKQDEIEK